jgi:hypothetical protein
MSYIYVIILGEIVFIPQYVINPVIEDDNAGRKPDQ